LIQADVRKAVYNYAIKKREADIFLQNSDSKQRYSKQTFRKTDFFSILVNYLTNLNI